VAEADKGEAENDRFARKSMTDRSFGACLAHPLNEMAARDSAFRRTPADAENFEASDFAWRGI
jgi:hypothetical protein